MSKLSWYTINQQDIILKLASLDLIELLFDEKGDVCVECSDVQKMQIQSLTDMDDEYFIELFDISP